MRGFADGLFQKRRLPLFDHQVPQLFGRGLAVQFGDIPWGQVQKNDVPLGPTSPPRVGDWKGAAQITLEPSYNSVFSNVRGSTRIGPFDQRPSFPLDRPICDLSLCKILD
jgi:hypothetical protein